MIEIQAVRKLGTWDVYDNGNGSLTVREGNTWELVDEGGCSCAAFKKRGACEHVETLFPRQKQSPGTGTPSATKRRAAGLSVASETVWRAPTAQLSVRYGTLRRVIAAWLRCLESICDILADAIEPDRNQTVMRREHNDQ